MPNQVADDVKRFLALHHRVSELNDEERQQYERLRARVQRQLREPDPTRPQADVPDEDEPLF